MLKRFFALAIISGLKGRSMKKIDETCFTEFGGEFRNKQRPTLEGIDGKYRRFN